MYRQIHHVALRVTTPSYQIRGQGFVSISQLLGLQIEPFINRWKDCLLPAWIESQGSHGGASQVASLVRFGNQRTAIHGL